MQTINPATHEHSARVPRDAAHASFSYFAVRPEVKPDTLYTPEQLLSLTKPLSARFYEAMRERGFSANELLEGTNLVPASLQANVRHIPWADFRTIVKNGIRLTGDPALGLWFGRRVKVTSMGLLGLATLASPTIGDCMMLFARYGSLIARHVQCEVEFVALEEGGDLIPSLRFDESLPHGDIEVFLMEATMRFVGDLAQSWRVDDVTDRLRFEVAYEQPAHWSHGDFEYHVDFGRPTHRAYGDDLTAINSRLLTADPSTFRRLEPVLNGQRNHAAANKSLADRVRDGLRRSFRSGVNDLPSADEMAALLGCTPRQLRKELAENGHGYRELTNNIRRELATEILANGGESIGALSSRLGYRHPTSFRRAFIRWTGQSPREYRQRQSIQ